MSLLIWVVGYYSINQSQKVLEGSIMESSESLANEIMEELDREIYTKIEAIQLYSKDIILQETIIESNREFEELDNPPDYINNLDQEWVSLPEGEISPFMEDIIDRDISSELSEKIIFYEEKYGRTVFGEIFITNKYGAVVAMTERTSDYRQDDEEWWQNAKEDGLWVGDVDYDDSAGIYSLDIAVRIGDEQGNFIGVIKAVLNIEDVILILEEAPEELAGKYQNSKFRLLTEDGRLIYSTDDYVILEDASYLLPVPEYLDTGNEGESEEHSSPLSSQKKTLKNGEEVKNNEILSVHIHSEGYRDYLGQGWILIVEHNKEEIFEPIAKLRDSILIVSLIITVMVLFSGLSFSSALSQSIKRLRDASVQVGKGNLDTPFDVDSRDEIGELASSFRKMTRDLQKTIVSKEYVDNIMKSMTASVVVLSPEGKIERANDSTYRMLGYEKDLVGRSADILFADGEDQNDSGIIDLMLEGFVSNKEKNYLTKDGRKIPVLFSGTIMGDNQGEIRGMVFEAIDITPRKKAEKELKKRLEDLERMQKAFVGRELRMKELKGEIMALKNEKNIEHKHLVEAGK